MQNKSHKNGIASGILLPMGLVCLFAFCSLALALFGGRAYRQIQASVDDSYGSTVAASYLRTKLGQHNRSGDVYLRQSGDTQLLVIESEASGVNYETRIYVKEGALYENFERADASFEGLGGMRIADVSGCKFTLDDEGLFTAEITSIAGTVTSASFAVVEGGHL